MQCLECGEVFPPYHTDDTVGLCDKCAIKVYRELGTLIREIRTTETAEAILKYSKVNEFAREMESEIARRCPHIIVADSPGEEHTGAHCKICGRHYGWYCYKSKDHLCHYWTDRDREGYLYVKLADGDTDYDLPKDYDAALHNQEYCIFCGEPEERK
jgi:hypothetical protein